MSRSNGIPGLIKGTDIGLPVYALRPPEMSTYLQACQPSVAAYIQALAFAAKARTTVLVPGPHGVQCALFGLGTEHPATAFGALTASLPAASVWSLMPGDFDRDDALFRISTGAYRYDRFKSSVNENAVIAISDDQSRPVHLARAICFARDLINTPANILGPAELADAGAEMAGAFGASIKRITGDALAEGYPALAAVGAGSDRAPQMLRFLWGDDARKPLIALCGKGVCFDTGGYDIKPSSAMLRMKKDMGGAAITLGVAYAIMALDLPVRLDVRIGCVENSISGHAMRPLDVLRTRAGLTVEVGNTDAEGRLVLADLLADAAAFDPDWMIDFATLTGAARVALGPDLPALFSNDDDLAASLLAGGAAAHDPLWRLPLWSGYDTWLDSNVADFNSVGSKPMAGAIVAALFLNRFVPASIRWAHIDTYAWNDQSRPGRPEGGEAQALCATVAAVERYTYRAKRKLRQEDG